MYQQIWAGENRKITVCVDSYEDGILRGRFYNAYWEMEYFRSLTQLLIGVEAILEERQEPQAYTAPRRFLNHLPADGYSVASRRIRRGDAATFEVYVLFRQHTSWQGIVRWQERKMEESFRSVLELVLLMDSALRAQRNLAV
jgi:hypothetical protein